VEFARERHVLLVRHEPAGIPLDFSLARLPFEEEAIRRGEERDYAGVTLRIARPEDLAIYKLVAARPRDLDDAERLLLLHGTSMDVARVVRIVSEFAEALEAPERLETLESSPQSSAASPDRGGLVIEVPPTARFDLEAAGLPMVGKEPSLAPAIESEPDVAVVGVDDRHAPAVGGHGAVDFRVQDVLDSAGQIAAVIARRRFARPPDPTAGREQHAFGAGREAQRVGHQPGAPSCLTPRAHIGSNPML
jgi:hypothetical protein